MKDKLSMRITHLGSRMVFRDGHLFFSIGDRGCKNDAACLEERFTESMTTDACLRATHLTMRREVFRRSGPIAIVILRGLICIP